MIDRSTGAVRHSERNKAPNIVKGLAALRELTALLPFVATETRQVPKGGQAGEVLVRCSAPKKVAGSGAHPQQNYVVTTIGRHCPWVVQLQVNRPYLPP
jgi:hypothetical protein